jgi:hypothetical protein
MEKNGKVLTKGAGNGTIVAGNIVLTAKDTGSFGLMRWVVSARSTDSTRYNMMGMLVEKVGDDFNFVSSDGKRIHILTMHRNWVRDSLPALSLMMGDRTEFNMSVEKVTAKEIVFGGEIEGRFPNYRKCIPEERGTALGVDFGRNWFEESVYHLNRAGVMMKHDHLKALSLLPLHWTCYYGNRASGRETVTVIFESRYKGDKLQAVIMPLVHDEAKPSDEAAIEAKPHEEAAAEPDKGEKPQKTASGSDGAGKRSKAEKSAGVSAMIAEHDKKVRAFINGIENDPQRLDEFAAFLRSINRLSPCAGYSLRNKILLAVSGTNDARTLFQWRADNRKVKKGAKAIRLYGARVFRFEDTEPCDNVQTPYYYEPLADIPDNLADSLHSIAA